jgi:hypothetical protein
MQLRAVLVAIVLEVRRQLAAPLARGARLLKTASCMPPKHAWRKMACRGPPPGAARVAERMCSHGHARAAPGARARGDAMYRPV